MAQVIVALFPVVLTTLLVFSAHASESVLVSDLKDGFTFSEVLDSDQINPNLMSDNFMDGCNSSAAASAPVENKHLSEVAAFPNLGTATSELSVIIDQVINVGQKIWNVISLGQPVVNLKLDSANALPKGITCWTQLQGWNVPKSKLYRIQYESLGRTAADLTFRVVSIAGGNYNGKGKYITNASVQVANLQVNWLYTFNVQAEIPMVFNQGTSEDPVAALQLNVNVKLDSKLSHKEQTLSFFLTGDGKITPIR